MTELPERKEMPSEIPMNVRHSLRLITEDEPPPNLLTRFTAEVDGAANLAEAVEIARRYSREHLGVERIPMWGENAEEAAKLGSEEKAPGS
ncbi:MAG: hypothetical protein ABI726_09555 [bacterium]